MVWAEDGEDQDVEITDQQRCTEWAQMDGIAKEDLADYMKECIASLGYEAGMGEEENAE
jgi:DNA primase